MQEGYRFVCTVSQSLVIGRGKPIYVYFSLRPSTWFKRRRIRFVGDAFSFSAVRQISGSWRLQWQNCSGHTMTNGLCWTSTPQSSPILHVALSSTQLPEKIPTHAIDARVKPKSVKVLTGTGLNVLSIFTCQPRRHTFSISIIGSVARLVY
jgi:hypothetical protein